MIKILDSAKIAEMTSNAKASSRRRAHHTIHTDHTDPVQRLAIAPQLGTYCQAHRHPWTWEVMTILSGAIKVFVFDETGTITSIITLDADGGDRVVELDASLFHTFITLKENSLVFEVKQGPYRPNSPEDTASFMVAESDPAAPEFEKFLHTAKVGDNIGKLKA